MSQKTPIVFTHRQVQQILDGRKTLTIRAVKDDGDTCRYGRPGDTLYVQERHQVLMVQEDCAVIRFPGQDAKRLPLDGSADTLQTTAGNEWAECKALPPELTRANLTITKVAKRPIQSLSGDELTKTGFGGGLERFPRFWDHIYRGYRWDDNPTCWFICFALLRPVPDEQTLIAVKGMDC